MSTTLDDNLERATAVARATPVEAREPYAPSSRADEHEKLATEAELRARKLEALGTLAGSIAHDFHNALQSITGNTALAQRCLDGGHPARAFLDEVAASAARAGDLVQRILTFSSPEEARHSPISVQAVVAEALERLRSTLPPQIVVQAELADDVPCILADPGQIQHVVSNLASNAVQALGSAGGTIDVWLGTTLLAGPRSRADEPLGTTTADGGSARDLPAGAYAALHVSDDGRGMDASTLASVFDPFSSTRSAGQGLGLATVHNIMKGLGGAVTARSEVDGGSTFSLYFPTMHAPSDASSRRPAGLVDARGGRVLFVDDEEVLVSLGTHILEVLGYEVTGTAQPLDALKRFVEQPHAFDVVVTDLSMPGLSGFQLAQQLLAVRADVPIVMMSGNVGPEELAQARRIGLRELLLKPVGMDDLNRTLARVLAATRRKAAVHKS
jgi:signal transduction histidine kinase/CheY-like chemotaxis protein